MTTGRLRGAAEFLRTFAVAGPPLVVVAWCIIAKGIPAQGWIVLCVAVGSSFTLVWFDRGIASRRLRTIASVLAAYRERDFTIRVRSQLADGAGVRDVLDELNQLGDALRAHRLGELEAWTLLRKVMAEIDVVVLALDDQGRVKLANDAAQRQLGSTSSIVGSQASTLGLTDVLLGTVPRVVADAPALGAGPWELRRGTFRLSGEQHTLVVLSDLSGALRDQEREAWKRLIRVMGHEINNSLAPIQSIAASLQNGQTRSPRPEDWEADVRAGLTVIARRADALGRFMTAYASLAKLPPPQFGPVDVAAWVSRATALERRVGVDIVAGPEMSVRGDVDQLDQLLINLVKNAAEASLEGDGGVRVRWFASDGNVNVVVEDDGPGVSETANLFVPFFTTKPEGSGIGLVLVRQIVEAHGGSVALRTRTGGVGAEAVVRLPLSLR